MNHKIERKIPYMENGEQKEQTLFYTVVTNKNNIVTNVFNKKGYSVNKNSECFEYFSKQFNK